MVLTLISLSVSEKLKILLFFSRFSLRCVRFIMDFFIGKNCVAIEGWL